MMRYTQPGTIVGFIGRMGSGKTYNQTRLAHMAYRAGRTIYANYSTIFATKITSEVEMYGHVDTPGVGGVEHGVLLADELGFMLDSRSFAANARLSIDLMLFRKRDLSLFYTVQDFTMIDIRVRNQTSFVLFHTHHPLGAIVYVYQQGFGGSFSYLKKYGLRFVPRVFNLYDTKDRAIILESREQQKKKASRSSAPGGGAGAGSLPPAAQVFNGGR